LQGLIVAHKIIDPVHQTSDSEYSYATGILDQNNDDELIGFEKAIRNQILTNDYFDASMGMMDI